ncbi:MAG: energy transducer TonB [Terriglobia bacterium]
MELVKVTTMRYGSMILVLLLLVVASACGRGIITAPARTPAGAVQPDEGPKSAPSLVRHPSSAPPLKPLHAPEPDYPLMAKRRRIQGIVRFEAWIATDGTIKNLRLIDGHPLLVRAAMDSARRWRFRPITLKGEPVEVLTEIRVVFELDRADKLPRPAIPISQNE